VLVHGKKWRFSTGGPACNMAAAHASGLLFDQQGPSGRLGWWLRRCAVQAVLLDGSGPKNKRCHALLGHCHCRSRSRVWQFSWLASFLLCILIWL
jgi:hypothetical protein